ncbi:MAG: peptidoglycan DD-metalloendopeptidase family protein [Magnetococcales bacterium]|nr:peptidoglycan DD-metalloendopeptidase family protein [Magnetococcales bacterium]
MGKAPVRVAEGPPLAWGLEPTTQRIQPSKTGTYLVQPGDSLWAIAFVHEIELEDLAAWNGIHNPDQLVVGQKLRTVSLGRSMVPTHVAKTASHSNTFPYPARFPVYTSQPIPNASSTNSSKTGNNRTTKVHSASLDKKQQGNGTLQSGHTKTISSNSSKPSTASGGKASRRPMTAPNVKPKSKVGTPPRNMSPEQLKKQRQKWKRNNTWILKAKAPKRWIWPLPGHKKVIKRFTTRGSKKNSGIDISAPEGTPIRAAAGGVVSYADDGLPGYGHLIIIRHGGSYMTAYAHTKQILVQRGQTVKPGQIIAHVGKTGRVASSRLHFELRWKIKPLNPLKHISRKG